ncbi:MAG: hypothetical protein COX57_04990 [Alphaproteobacteria bacterium CG_4_10_14_0_2_um_filter_63_37]|nr:MAG: hypothetical protein AUJ55_01865 [Proteobacteria bacterium CG1_02_64_396]PJA25125.1 MAG: hypothetical protein COX57_04990 [Alphaproteobacteria bacterium CG_4_10_14_0_2_um_filter_63_37]
MEGAATPVIFLRGEGKAVAFLAQVVQRLVDGGQRAWVFMRQPEHRAKLDDLLWQRGGFLAHDLEERADPNWSPVVISGHTRTPQGWHLVVADRTLNALEEGVGQANGVIDFVMAEWGQEGLESSRARYRYYRGQQASVVYLDEDESRRWIAGEDRPSRQQVTEGQPESE